MRPPLSILPTLVEPAWFFGICGGYRHDYLLMFSSQNVPQRRTSQSPESTKTIQSEQSRPSTASQEPEHVHYTSYSAASQCPHVEQISDGAAKIIRAVVSWKYGRAYQRTSTSKRRKVCYHPEFEYPCVYVDSRFDSASFKPLNVASVL